MKEYVDMIFSSFQECKENGSYILFYLLALGLGLAAAWERFGQTKPDKYGMQEQAKTRIQLWPFLYGLLALILVAANPAAVWILNQITPIGSQYYKLWSLLLFLFLCAYGMVCFLSLLKEQKQKILVTAGFVILIGLAGSGYGILSERTIEVDVLEVRDIAQIIKEEDSDALVLAAKPVLEYVGIYEPNIQVLYGKDLYTQDMDLGIVDAYPQEFLHLYEIVEQPQGHMGELSNAALIYGCDIIVVKRFENAPDKAGAYYKREVTENYMVYIR